MAQETTTKTPSGVLVDGDAVRNRRKRLGHTITDLAPMVGISIGYLSQIELGHRPSVSPPTALALAHALGLEDAGPIERRSA